MNELYHYGVLGMKWGVRKDKDSTGKKKGIPDKASEYKTYSPNGDSITHIRGKKDFAKLEETARKYENEGKLNTPYGDERENAYKLSQVKRARMTLRTIENFDKSRGRLLW